MQLQFFFSNFLQFVIMAVLQGTKALESWCCLVTEGYANVTIVNMSSSWRNGMAFCAIIHKFRPELINFDTLDPEDAFGNNELAFTTAEQHLGIPALLDPQDMVECEVLDRLSILTYLSQFYQVIKRIPAWSLVVGIGFMNFDPF